MACDYRNQHPYADCPRHLRNDFGGAGRKRHAILRDVSFPGARRGNHRGSRLHSLPSQSVREEARFVGVRRLRIGRQRGILLCGALD